MSKREFAEYMKGGYKLLLPRTDLELGYINGYRWGVEYPTNCKKPDLPDTILVDVRSNRMKDWHIKGPQEVGGWQWGDLGSGLFFEFFRIVDQRYKPVDASYLVSKIPESKSNAENVSEWYDYEAQKAVALPPVDFICESFDYQRNEWVKVKTLEAETKSKELACVTLESEGHWGWLFWGCKFRPLDHVTRKAEAEKNRVVDAAFDEAIKAGCVDFRQWLSVIYDAGFLRMPAE